MSEWKSAIPSRGSFIGWGLDPGQHVTGEVVSFAPNGGTDPDGEVCPEVSVRLTEPAYSVRGGERTDFSVGDVVTVTCAQGKSKKTGNTYGLRRDIVTVNPQPGQLIKILLESLRQTAKSPQKVFDIKTRDNDRPNGQQPVSQPVQGELQGSPPF
jgi:hypothetical protein